MGNAINKLVYHPPQPPTYAHESSDLDIVWLTTRLGNDIPVTFTRNERAPLTVLYSHGNAEDLGIATDWAREFSRKCNVSVLCLEYAGYGLSSGKPSEANTYADIEAAYEYLTKGQGIDASDIVLYGRSLGSGPTSHLASMYPEAFRGVILHSPLASAFRVAMPTRWTMPGDMYANIDKLGAVMVPVFIMHGTEDEVVPFKAGKALHRILQRPHKPWWVEGAGHNNIEYSWRADYFNNVRSFLRTLEAA